MRILAIGAHPDDLELACGGTLAKYSKEGADITMAYATNGDMGHKEILPEELAEIRKAEAQAANELIGAKLIWMDYPDEWLFSNRNARETFIDVIRRARPDVIITHCSSDYHPDHRAVSELAFGASFLSSIPHIKTPHVFHGKIPPIYYMEPLAGLADHGFYPDTYIDISDVFTVKREMLACHQSQLQWLKEHDNIDFIDFMETVAKFRGLQCGVPYAEGFVKATVWPRLKPASLLEAGLDRV